MTLQSSGTITLFQIQAEYGGSNPIQMSEYYRNGGNVPSTITSGAGSFTSYTGNTSTYYWNSLGVLRWNNVQITTGATGTSFTSGGYEYQRQSSHFTSTYDKFVGTVLYYRVRRRTTGTTITVNSNVPTSGTIQLNDFYGGRKT